MFNDFDGLKHRPVLYQEIIYALQPVYKRLFVDCTVGAGGHSFGLLEASSPDGRLLGLDVDPRALELAHQRLYQFGDRVILVQASYATLQEQLEKIKWPPVNGILLDLGISSMQVDTAERGFSFLSDAPLDMRFDPRNPNTAADLVNTMNEKELADLIYQYGEEHLARQIARAIVRERPLTSTFELSQLVARVVGGHRSHGRRDQNTSRSIHPATRTFQALRIAVNDELNVLAMVLPQAVECLAPGGRLAVISFHSLEDRIVKQFFQQESQDCICPPVQPVCTCGHHATITRLTKHPIRPQPDEVEINPRARSARLRVAMKL
jgi:16S rRNA (cytosine1402-N4)-methyltransferase